MNELCQLASDLDSEGKRMVLDGLALLLNMVNGMLDLCHIWPLGCQKQIKVNSIFIELSLRTGGEIVRDAVDFSREKGGIADNIPLREIAK